MKLKQSVTFRNLIHNKNNIHVKSRAGVYEILCQDNNKKYMYVNLLSLNKRIYEHTRDLKRGNINNGLIKHNLETNHNFNFKDSKILVYICNKKCWKIFEFSIISNENTIKEISFFNLSPYLVRLMLKNYKIPYSK